MCTKCMLATDANDQPTSSYVTIPTHNLSPLPPRHPVQISKFRCPTQYVRITLTAMYSIYFPLLLVLYLLLLSTYTISLNTGYNLTFSCFSWRNPKSTRDAQCSRAFVYFVALKSRAVGAVMLRSALHNSQSLYKLIFYVT